MKTILFSIFGAIPLQSPEYKLKYRDSMPAPFHPVLIAATCLASLASGVAAMMVTAIPNQDPEILVDHFLTILCLSGSLGGGVISVLLFSTTESRRQQAAKFIVSGFTGMIVTPFLMKYMGWQELPSLVLFASAAVALLSWSVLIPLVPWVASVITSVIQKKVDSNPPKDS